jgi:hypothetical protein
MHYMDPTHDDPAAALAWFARPCSEAFAVMRRRFGYSAACIAAGSFGCRVEFARRGNLLAVTYWLGLPPIVELVRRDADLRSRVTFPWLPPRALPRVVASLHARLRAAAGDFATLEADADKAVAPCERPALARAMHSHLRVVAADLLRRHRAALAPELTAPRSAPRRARHPSRR